MTVNIHEAKTRLSQLLEQVQAGEEVVIAKAGRPIARLVPFDGPCKPRVPGNMKGKIWISDDFDAPLPDEIQRFFE